MSNRAITLEGANKIFGAVGIEITEIPTGGYQSGGFLSMNHKTLTGLCQTIVNTLMNQSLKD